MAGSLSTLAYSSSFSADCSCAHHLARHRRCCRHAERWRSCHVCTHHRRPPARHQLPASRRQEDDGSHPTTSRRARVHHLTAAASTPTSQNIAIQSTLQQQLSGCAASAAPTDSAVATAVPLHCTALCRTWEWRCTTPCRACLRRSASGSTSAPSPSLTPQPSSERPGTARYQSAATHPHAQSHQPFTPLHSTPHL